ncbi:MAG: hypothetical protein CSA15_06745 [Candidatus Delongbacteria bacterium]|nr:MAG: hypothetical protein CSA15_06745 [Candidatus Delongbacteria bacterium]
MAKKIVISLIMLSFFLFSKENSVTSNKKWDYFRPKIKSEVSLYISKKVKQEMKNVKDVLKLLRIEKKLWKEESKKIVDFVYRNMPKGKSAKRFGVMIKDYDKLINSEAIFYSEYLADTNNKDKSSLLKFKIDQQKSKFDFYLKFIKNNLRKTRELKKFRKMKKDDKKSR